MTCFKIAPLWALSVLVLGQAELTFAQDEDSSDIVLRDKVKKSIQFGTDYLRRSQRADGAWAPRQGNLSGFEPGITAIALLAQLNCDVPADAPHIQLGLKYLRSITPVDLRHGVYESSLIIMALCAAEEYDRDMQRIRLWSSLLQRSQITEGVASGLWDYKLEGRVSGGDRSNGQYAVLALRDAAYAGVPIDRDVWQRTHDHWIRGQEADGGWGYEPGRGGGATGSMTAAGLSTIAITTRMLQDDSDVDADGRVDPCAVQRPDEAFQRGIAWLTRHFNVSVNPRGRSPQQWHFYYLYGLERAGRLGGVRFFGLNDWYRMGARTVVDMQKPGGEWSTRSAHEGDPILATSFALLFLSKGMSRVVVNKLDYTSEGLENDRTGEWNRHYLDVSNLVDHVDTLDRWPPRLTSQVLSMGRLQEPTAVLDMNQAPVLYISGSDEPVFNDQQVRWLRQYIDEGGFIFAQANCQGGTFDAGFRDLVTRMFPEGEASLARLQADHPVYRSEYLLDSENIEFWGVDFGCRTAIVYSPEDHAAYWHKWSRHNTPGRSQALAQRILRSTRAGVNVLAYATGREPPEKLNADMTEKDRAGGQAERGLLAIARIRHNGGWDTAPRAVRNLLNGLNRTLGVAVSPKPHAVPVTYDALARFPMAYMHGRYGFRLQAGERKALRDYLDQGTMLLADACCGSKQFDRSFRDLMKQMYPDHPLEPIPEDHEMFTDAVAFDVREVARRSLITGSRTASLESRVQQGPPLLEGIRIDGQYVVIYSQYDISCALENQASLACDGYVEEDAMKLAINMVAFALLQQITK